MTYNATIPARPTVYKGVTMRSRLEAAWAEQFDALGWSWEYEPVCLANEHGQYLPDFRVFRPGAPRAMWWEIKGGWWDSPDSEDYNAELDRQQAEKDRWWSIIHEFDPTGSFVLAYQPCWTACHSIDVRTPMQLQPCCAALSYAVGPTFSAASICGCSAGCRSVVARAGTVCAAHHELWRSVDLVDSLHGELFPPLPGYFDMVDPLSLILDWRT